MDEWMGRRKREKERMNESQIDQSYTPMIMMPSQWFLPFPHFSLIPAPTCVLFPSLSTQMKNSALFLFLPKYPESKDKFAGRQGTKKGATSELLPHHQSSSLVPSIIIAQRCQLSSSQVCRTNTPNTNAWIIDNFSLFCILTEP